MKFNEAMFLGDNSKDSVKDIDEKVIELLKEKGKLTYHQIVDLLKLENGDKDILVNVLLKMVFSGKIKKENISEITSNGIRMTSRFSFIQ